MGLEFIMSRNFLALIALAGLALPLCSAAVAADAIGDYVPPAESKSAKHRGYRHNWSGAYAGVQLGSQSPDAFKPFASRSGWTMGAQGGMLFQKGPLVYGGEVEGNLSSGTQFRKRGGAGFEQRSTVAAKARMGVAIERTLIYGTLGYGWTKLKSKGTVISDDQWEGGLLYGAGVEQALGRKTSLRLEYTIQKLNDVDSITAGGVRRSDDRTSHHLKLGFNYRF